MRRATFSAQHYLHGPSATPSAHPSGAPPQQDESVTPLLQPQAMQTQIPPTTSSLDAPMDIDFDDSIGNVVSLHCIHRVNYLLM